MATINELKEVQKEHLEGTGTLNEIRSRMRAEIFNTLNNKNTEKPQLSKQNLIINELIREYLIFNNYNYSNAVFVPESGQPDKKLEREFLSKQLNIVEDTQSRQLPLLYSNFSLCKKRKRHDFRDKNYSK